MLSVATLLMLAPALLILVVLFAGGVAIAVMQSAGSMGLLLSDREFHQSLLLTAAIAFTSTFVSTLAGVGLAIGLHGFKAGRQFLATLLQLPIAIPHVVIAVFVLNLLSQSGLIARVLSIPPGSFPALVNDRYGIGILVAYVLKETPFIAIMALAILARTGSEYAELASTLGASGWQQFRYVTLPLLAPAVLSASVIVFAFVFGAYEVPFLLGRPYPAMLGVVAQRRFTGVDLAERPAAFAVSVTTSIITAALVWAYLKLARVQIGERPTIF